MRATSLPEAVIEKSAVGPIFDFRIMSGYEKSSKNANKLASLSVSVGRNKPIYHFGYQSQVWPFETLFCQS